MEGVAGYLLSSQGYRLALIIGNKNARKSSEPKAELPGVS
jgi:hypothetical protein